MAGDGLTGRTKSDEAATYRHDVADPLRLAKRSWLKRLLPKTLFGRTLMIIVTPGVLMQVIATFVFYDRHVETVSNRLTMAVAGDIALVIDRLDRVRNDEAAIEDLLRAAAASTDLLIAYDRGAKLDGSENTPISPTIQRAFDRAMGRKVPLPYQIDPLVKSEWWEITVELPTGVLRVMTPQRRVFTDTIFVFLLWMVGSTIALFGVAIVFMRNQIRPIRRLAAAADRLGKGMAVGTFKPEGATEVRQAGAAFLVMRDRISRQLAQRTEMLAGVSHDLRTPLTRMRLELAMLGDSPEIEDLRTDLDEMERMIEGYLAFARGEGDEVLLRCRIAALVEEVVNAARRQDQAIAFQGQTDLQLVLRPNAVKRCIANLVANAQRYGTNVWVSVIDSGGRVEIHVDDDGPGIPPDRRDDVFRPFVRTDASRNQKTGGTGLGLTIARDIARGHGGDVRLTDSPSGGLRAIIMLPI